jgi:hypothetical protein
MAGWRPRALVGRGDRGTEFRGLAEDDRRGGRASVRSRDPPTPIPSRASHAEAENTPWLQFRNLTPLNVSGAPQLGSMPPHIGMMQTLNAPDRGIRRGGRVGGMALSRTVPRPPAAVVVGVGDRRRRSGGRRLTSNTCAERSGGHRRLAPFRAGQVSGGAAGTCDRGSNAATGPRSNQFLENVHRESSSKGCKRRSCPRLPLRPRVSVGAPPCDRTVEARGPSVGKRQARAAPVAENDNHSRRFNHDTVSRQT